MTGWRRRKNEGGVSMWRIGVLVLTMGLSAFAGEATWLTDVAEAKKQAAERHVPILADFSGSDWCGWCKKLDKEVFSQEAFQNFAQTNLVLLLVDFPRSKPQPPRLIAQNEELQRRFRVEGFPTVLLLDADGKEFARTGYKPGGAEAYIEHLKGLQGKPQQAPVEGGK